MDALDAALGIWRGPALAQFAYEDFARSATARWEELRHLAREDRMEALLALGAHNQAVAELEAMVADAPLRERRWELLVLALYRCGRQADGLRAYAKARTLLAEEMGVDPGPALARMEADVLAHAPHLDWHPPEVVPAVPAGATPAASGQPVAPASAAGARTQTQLVGRERELARLAAAVDDVVAGQPRVVLIGGEAGIGKSRLLDELAGSAAGRGALVAWGRAFEGGAAPPFWPWVQVLRALAGADADAEAMREAAGAGAGAVAQLVPELAGRWGISGPPDPPGDPETARFRLYEAVAAMLRAASGRRPVVVLLDDLHWSDPASLGLTTFVAAQPSPGRVLLAASYRPEEAAAHDDLAAALAAFARLPALDRIDVPGLPPPEVARFVAEAAGVEPSPELVGTLHSRTDGNPFYLGELVRLLAAERSLAAPAAAIATAIPAGVRDVVRRRLARLPAPSNALLRLAAVVGREFDLAILAAAAPVDEEEALLLIEAALLIGVVVEAPTVGGYRFAHALVRDAVYEQLSAVRRARLHGQVGRTLQDQAQGDDRLDELAHHFFEAAPADGPDEAFAYAMRAADAAQAQLAYEDVRRHLQRALELVGRMPQGPERAGREIDVQLRVGGFDGMVRSFAAAEGGRAWARIAELCREFGLADRLLGSLSGQWIFTIMRGDYDGAWAVHERVADLARATGDPTAQMLVEFELGYLALYRADLVPALGHIDEAIRRVRALDAARLAEVIHLLPESLFLALSSLGLWLLGENEEARARMDTSLVVAEESGHPFTLALGCANVCMLDAWAGDPVALLERSERGLAMTSLYGLQMDEALLRVMRGWARARLGEAEAGAAEAEAAMAEVKAVGRVMSRPWLLALLAEALRGAERLDDAVTAIDDAVEVMDGSREMLWAAELYRLRGELLLERWPERRGEAVGWLRRAVEVATAQGAAPLRRRAEDSLAQRETAPAPR